MNIVDLIKYFHLEDAIEKKVEFYGFDVDRLELSALCLLDEAEARDLPYIQAIELCRICQNCLGLEGGISNPFTGKKIDFGRVLLKAALALQENMKPPAQIQIKNVNTLTSYHTLIQHLEAEAHRQTPSEVDLRALIQLAMIAGYDHENLIALYKMAFSGEGFFKSAFETP